MTWARVVATGSGAIAYRLMILGHGVEFVSSSSLIGAGTDGRLRIGGLDARSISWGESLDPAQCKLTARGCTVRIVEDGEHRTGDSFVRQPSKTLYLSSSVTDAVVAIPLDSLNTSAGDVLYIGQECVHITAGAGTAAPTVTRGYRQTRAQHHYVDASLGLTRPEVTDRRPTIEGTVAYIFAYGDGETGDGTPVWRGIVAAQPKLRGLTTWEVVLDSVTSILDQSIGADLQDPVTLRGIVYTSNTVPLLHITRLGDKNVSDAVTTDTAEVTLPSGFYESQEAWCLAVNAAITTATAGWSATNPLNVASGANPRIIAQPDGSGSWQLVITTKATPYWYTVTCGGPIDPSMSSAYRPVYTTGGTATETLAASTSYIVQTWGGVDGAGTVPRGLIGSHWRADAYGRMRETRSLYAYLGGVATASTTDALTVEWPEFNGLPSEASNFGITAWDATTRRATVTAPTERARAFAGRLYTRDSTPTITVTRNYVTSGDVGDFLAALVAGASEGAAAGRQPYVTLDHIDTVTTSATVTPHVAGFPWVAARFYGGTSDVALGKVLVEECKLAGLVPSITTTGALVLVPFRVGAATETAAYTIDASTNLSGAQLPGYEPSAFGLLNTVKLMTGFDPLDGKHRGDTYVVRDAGALSRNPLPSVMKIEPRSSAVGGDRGIPTDQVLALAQAWLGVLGAAYATATITCPLSAVDAVIGSQVSITVSQIPDTENGGRGVASIAGVVIGRSVRPLDACVELTLLTTQVRIAGYTPSSLVTSVSAGATRDVLLNLAQPTGYADASWWTVGDAVVLRQYDTATPIEITATVTAVDTATRTVTIGTISDVTPGGTLTLEYGVASAATAHQQTYCYIADDADSIAFSTAAAARQFAA